MTGTEWAAAQRAAAELRGRVGELRSRYGGLPQVRRLEVDLDRFDIDLAELGELPEPPVRSRAGDQEEVIPVPSASGEEPHWPDEDDEGIGGHPS